MEKGRLLVREDITIYMGTYEFTNPQFFFRFQLAARLGKPGTRTMALRVKIHSMANLPLTGCKVVVQPSRKDSKPLEGETSKAGRVQFQHIAKGKCTITVTMPGGETQQQEATIKASERADLLFVL